MNKYIVKNCECFVKRIARMSLGQKNQTCNNYKIGKLMYCKDIENCLIKQVIGKCKNQQKEFDKEIKDGNYPDKYKFFKSGRTDAGKEILQLFDIEEVE